MGMVGEHVRDEPGSGRQGGVRRVGSPLAMTMPADPALLTTTRKQLYTWLGDLGWPEESADDVVLAVSEAVSNAIEHAYPGRDRGSVHLSAEVAVARDGARVVVDVADHGYWRPAAADPYRHHGIKVMSDLMDRLELRSGPSGTTVTLTSMPVAPPPPATLVGARGTGRPATSRTRPGTGLPARPPRRAQPSGGSRRARRVPLRDRAARAARAMACAALACVTRVRRRASRRLVAALRLVVAVLRRMAAIRPMRGLMSGGYHADARFTASAAPGLP